MSLKISMPHPSAETENEPVTELVEDERSAEAVEEEKKPRKRRRREAITSGPHKNPPGFYQAVYGLLDDPYTDGRKFYVDHPTAVEEMTSYIDCQITAGLLKLVKPIV